MVYTMACLHEKRLVRQALSHYTHPTSRFKNVSGDPGYSKTIKDRSVAGASAGADS